MPSIITTKFRIHNAVQFYESLSEAVPSIYYLFIGRVTAWSNENSPPTPTNEVQTFEFDGHRDIVALKRIQASDVSHAIPRYNWTNNTSYKQYTDKDSNLYPTSTTTTSNTTFYVMTSDYNVYKCIDNNRGGRSTVKPTGVSTSITSTADGYRWKFMYKISAAEALKFLTTNYMPVKRLSTNDNSAQWGVQQAAANGAINHIKISANGSGYLWTSNLFASVVNSTTMTLAVGASGSDDEYNKSSVYIQSGAGAGQLRRIINYVASSRTITVNGAFTTSPNTGSRYFIGPNVIIRGDSGQSQSLQATAYVSNCAGGQIRKITMIAAGFNYSTANVTISANSGSGGLANAIISPPGGHGYNPIEELGGYNIMTSVSIYGTEANSFPANNNFRTIGILKDPLLRSGPVANASVIDQTYRLSVTSLNGDLTADEIITGGTSGAKGRLVVFANTNAARTAGIVKLVRVSTDGNGRGFATGETITGQTSGKTATISSIARPALREYSGDIIYTENRTPISRATNQIENIRILTRF